MKILREIKRLWLKFAHALGWFNTRVLLAVTFFTVIAIPSIIVLIARKDLLRKRLDPKALSYWDEKPPQTHTVESASRQF
jgi:hypothetical protein